MAHDPNADPPRKRRGGLLWLLGPIALVILALVLLRSCGDDDSSSGAAMTTGQTTSEIGAGDNDGSGSITAGDEDLLAAAAGNASGLGRLEGEDVEATGVTVESVVNETGFWIGSGESDRVFVEVEQEGSASVEVQKGDAASFTGVLEKNKEAETYGLREEDGAQQFRDQGFHVQVQAGELKTG